MSRNTQNTQKLAILSVLVALQIVLARFCSFNAWNARIGIGFLPVALSGILFGPLYAALVAGLSDFLGALLFPVGAYFPGFTLTAALMGAGFGIFLYRRLSLLRILAAVALNQLVFSLLLNTLWISILYGADFRGLLSSRFLQLLVIAPIQFLLLSVLSSIWERTGLRQALHGIASDEII